MIDYKIGADPFPPFQYFDKDGNIRGSDYETINNVILKMGKQAEYILDNWDDVEQKLINKEIDIAFQVQKTHEREKKYYFSNLLIPVSLSFITRIKYQIEPIIGMRLTKIQPPALPISCIRRTLTANVGTSKANIKMT